MLKSLLGLFLKLGFIGFGGPAVHIAMMRNEIVARRKWMTDEEFLDLMGITNLIPGPNSTEMAIHLGKIKSGWKGLLVAGLCFILPAVILTLIIAHLYVKYGTAPNVQPFLYGIKPAIIAIIISAVWPLAKSSYKSTVMLLIGLFSFSLALYGLTELVIMAAAGISMLLIHYFKYLKNRYIFSMTLIPLSKLFFMFLKIGAILYGSGYVLFAFLETDLVNSGILSRAQLIDAIAVGQMTPGPLFSSVTFIGYLLRGWQGALVTTVGAFLPSFLFIAFLGKFFFNLRTSQVFRHFLNGVIAASVALIAAIAVTLGIESVNDWRTLVIALISLAVSFLFRRINSAFIVAGGALSGYILSFL